MTILQGADIEAQREVLAVLVDRVVPVQERPGVYLEHGGRCVLHVRSAGRSK